MIDLDVRRLAAIDMWGVAGTLRRRRIILLEFVIGAAAGVPLGVFVASSATATPWTVFGLWIAGMCANYIPLAWYAVTLSRGDALEQEIEGAGVEVDSELRSYTGRQFWIVVPLLFVVMDIRQRRQRGRDASA